MDVLRPRRRPSPAKLLGLVLVGLLLTGATALVLGRPPQLPSVPRAELWTGVVTRGPFVMEVHGAGTLKPEAVRWLTAESSGRVAAVLLQAGVEVSSETPVVQLENLDLRLQADHARRDVQDARARAFALERQSRSSELTLLAELAGIHASLNEARRSAHAYAGVEGEIVSRNESQRIADRVLELEERAALTENGLSLVRRMAPRELAAVRDQLQPLERVSEVRQQMLDRLEVRAGSSGRLQDVLVELGQWVVPGTQVAKVMLSSRLQAVLRIPADRAGQVRVGQRAEVRTSLGSSNHDIPGHVRRVAPAAAQGTVDVEVALEGELPENARPDQNVDGRIETVYVESALQVPRPVGLPERGDAPFFKLDAGGQAHRVSVRVGLRSVDVVEVLDGLTAGETVILSDMREHAGVDAVRVE
jgi:multidrug resistance efflux pump